MKGVWFARDVYKRQGKICAITYARENNVPLFAVGEGMQLCAIEFARNVANLKGADSVEFDINTPYPIYLLGGNQMRLGLYPCHLADGTKSKEAYQQEEIQERHRHRYEFNLDYKTMFEQNGLVFAGISPDGKYVEIIELKDHPWFVGTQFHPEFKSRPNRAHPLFKSFIKSCIKKRQYIICLLYTSRCV